MELRTAPITGVWARIRIALFVDSGRGNTRFLFQTRILSFRAERSVVENGAAAESRHRREGRRLSEREVSESCLSIYRLVTQRNQDRGFNRLIRLIFFARDLQLRLPGDRIAY